MDDKNNVYLWSGNNTNKLGFILLCSLVIYLHLTSSLTPLLITKPHKWQSSASWYWLMARSSSYIITNKDDLQDMINYL